MHGCPDQVALNGTNRHSEAFLQWDPLEMGKKTGCAQLQSYELEIKEPMVPWVDVNHKTTDVITGHSKTVSELNRCTEYQFRARARNIHCAGRYSNTLTIETECEEEDEPIVLRVTVKDPEEENSVGAIDGEMHEKETTTMTPIMAV